MTEIYVNFKYVGETENGKELAANIVDSRRKGSLSQNINVNYDAESDKVYIDSSRGRVRRPLIVVKDGKPLLTERHLQQLNKGELTWSDVLRQGVIEYLDAAEEETALIAFNERELTKEHTHLEITPLAMLGITASLVPYGNYNQGARMNFGAKNQKHAVGFYAANYPVRFDMDVNLLHEPQVPLVDTTMYDVVGYDKHPSGQNIVVAVMSYKGYNIEDAVIINQGSLDRGLFRSTYYRPETTEEIRYSGGLMDEIGTPDKEVKGYRTEKDYRFLQDDGIIFPEAQVAEGDVIIGKSSPPRFLSSMDEYNLGSNVRRESSTSISHGEHGTVDFVLVSESEEGNKLVQVRMREQRVPEIGDKFTSRHGQKGVVGLIVPQSDMPFTASGIVPDLITSPHGLPTRMTVSHLIELVGGKTGALAGRHIDGTIFEAEPEKDLRLELAKLGFREDGSESMYNGETGEMYTARIFVGNMFYLRLRHMVANKLHSRARGPIQLLTRQPTEGRAKEGGLRLGEMEKDTFVANGAAMLLKERFDSDKTIVPVCEKCGSMGYYNEYKKTKMCPVCGEEGDLANVEMAYAFKLILDELKSLGINPRVELEDKY
jgi:DNA-directed RNA polymerase subunit B'